jgi:hypothetical protein
VKREVKIGLGVLAFALIGGTYTAQRKIREFLARTPEPLKEVWETLPWLIGALALIGAWMLGAYWFRQWRAERTHADQIDDE